MSDQPMFVQFPHPGPEHDASGQDHMDWSLRGTPHAFGEHFTYSNCRQRTNQKLRHLPEGSVILFGSAMKMNGVWEFVLDTVVVIAGGAETYNTGFSPGLDCQQVIQDVVLGPMRSDPGCLPSGCRPVACPPQETNCTTSGRRSPVRSGKPDSHSASAWKHRRSLFRRPALKLRRRCRRAPDRAKRRSGTRFNETSRRFGLGEPDSLRHRHRNLSHLI
jgi:hypothetical protein